MASLIRVRALWTGVTGLPGVSTFYVKGAEDTTFIANLRAAFAAASDLFPSTLSIQVENSGDSIDDATGTLDGSWSGSSVLPVTGTAPSTTHAAGTGLRVRWGTGAIVGGRRLQGRTFLAPVSVAAYEADGTLTTSARTAAAAFGAEVVDDGRFAIWSRPTSSSSGTSSEITSSLVPDQVSSLRSRRS